MKGFIPPYQYAALNDFMARWGRKKYGNYTYYNAWHQDPDTTHLDDINKRRDQIGLNSFEQQEKNKLLNRERRKNRTANSEIVTE